MALPICRQSGSPGQPRTVGQMTMTGSPNLNILKEHLRATPGGSKGGYFFQKKAADIVNANPIVEAPGDNSFTPQKIKSKLQQVQGTPKPPKGPEKPRKPYTRYSRKVWDEVKTQNKELKLWEIRKIIGQMWRDLLDHEKAEITDKYESEKVEYDRQLKVYQASPAYQAYLQAKTKGAPVIQESKEAPSPAVGCAGKMSERRIYVQPVKDKDDLDDGLSVKHVAHARFMRNHQLIDKILSAGRGVYYSAPRNAKLWTNNVLGKIYD